MGEMECEICLCCFVRECTQFIQVDVVLGAKSLVCRMLVFGLKVNIFALADRK